MNVKDTVSVVTGGAQGIGLALCGALPVATDVGREEDIANLVSATVDRFERIDLDAARRPCRRGRDRGLSDAPRRLVRKALRNSIEAIEARTDGAAAMPGVTVRAES
jgi:NAD(P)-dependent dehydrogenase (short-subunit alcohol dehydrogenase family)